MCLLLLGFQSMPQVPWLLLGNRDEFHTRPSAAAHAWPERPQVIGGRDLEAGGTWLAVARDRRFAAVTNVRTGEPRRGVRSRGELVADFVGGSDSAARYAAAVARRRGDYGPFNLLLGDTVGAFAASSLSADAWALEPGVHVFSNGPVQARWPKVRRLEAAFAAASTIVDNAALLADAAASLLSGAIPTPFEMQLLDAARSARRYDPARRRRAARHRRRP
jgi:uncharacterized protein with NRDE domain